MTLFHTRAIITPADVAKAHCDCRHHKHPKAIQRSTPASSTPPRIKSRSYNARHHSSNQLSKSTSAFVVSMFHVKPYHALHLHPHTTTRQTTPYYRAPERQCNPPLKQGLIEWSTDRTPPHVRHHIHSDQNRCSALSYPMRAPPTPLVCGALSRANRFADVLCVVATTSATTIINRLGRVIVSTHGTDYPPESIRE